MKMVRSYEIVPLGVSPIYLWNQYSI